MGDNSLIPINASSPALHPKNRPNMPANAQTGTQSPWFMPRPKSSGIDTSGFSFAKPASYRQGFALRKPPKHPPVSSTPPANLLSLERQEQSLGESDNTSLIQARFAWMRSYHELFTDVFHVLCSRVLSQIEPEAHHLEARSPGQNLPDAKDADCSLFERPHQEGFPCVRIEDVNIQPKAGLDVPSQHITGFVGSRGGKVHQQYSGDDLGATVCQPK